MLGPSWVALFRKIPVALHDTLVMITVTGAEVMIQKILVLDDEYFVYRGRMSGVQDSGLVMMMPYDQISNLAFSKRMLEPEVREIFGGSAPTTAAAEAPAPAVTVKAETTPNPSAEADAADQPVHGKESPASAANDVAEPALKPTGKTGQPSRSTLLARLRARLAGQAKS